MITPLLAAALAAPLTDVWVVDSAGGPGSDYVAIDPAIAAASDGDVILVRPGFYDPFSVNGKSLVIVGDDGTLPAVNYTSTVSGLAADQRVILSGLQLGPTSLALQVTGCAGPVWVSGCNIEAHDTFFTGTPDAMRVTNCARVVLDDCLVAAPQFPHGGDALVATQSNLVLWDSVVRGGFPGGQPSLPGGAGLEQTGGSLFACGVAFQGGPGGDGGFWGPPTCFVGGDGGPGLSLEDVGATLRDHSTVGGPGGTTYGAPCADGGPGPGLSTSGATSVTTLSPTARSAELPRVARGGDVAPLELEGEPGDVALAFLGVGVLPFDALFVAGVVVPGPPWTQFAGATLDGSGQASIPIQVPTLPPTTEAVVATGQAIFFSAQDGYVLGSPFVSVVLGPGL